MRASENMGANTSLLSRSPSSQSRSGHNSGSLNSGLPPIIFHTVHGENIGLSRDGAVARRTDSFCKGIAFTSRPVKVNERIYLKFVETSTSWSGALRFGFTSVDPSHSRSGLPKYACPDLTNKPGHWAKALGERQAQRDSILFYYVNETGHVHYGINGEEKGIFFDGVGTTSPLWGMIDVYGNTVAVELVTPSVTQPNNLRQQSVCENSRQVLNNHRSSVIYDSASPAPVTSEPDTNRLSLRLSSLNIDQLDNVQAENSLPIRVYQNAQFSSLPFHKTKGSNVFLSNSSVIAERSDSHYCQGYVFTSRPLRLEERLVIQILKTERSYVGALTFGLTTCDPATLNVNQQELPDDPDMLLDRREYWVLRKDVAESPQKGDELAFMIRSTGEVQLAKNHQPLKTIMHVDQTQQLWAFFDLYGNTLKIKSLGITSSDCSVATTHRLQRSQTLDPSSTSFLDSSTSSPIDAGINGGAESGVGMNNECTLCFERVINCVLYDCGHLCMCYTCAQIQWKNPRGGFCPICRKAIRDVVRIYRT